ncbi:MAG TPA: aminopeptidase P family protein [Bacteroidales bacterium]|nr:aminopeptidase P family protein [Bacteroidales bacterium]
MKAYFKLGLTLAAGLAILSNSGSINAQSVKEFQLRRKAVIEEMKPNSIMILHTEAEPSGLFNIPRFGGFFYYLTGINEPNVYLVLKRESTGSDGMEILFIEPIDKRRADWDAPGFGIEGAKENLRFNDVRSNKEFETFFENALLENPRIVYMDYRHFPSTGFLSYYEQFFKKVKEMGASFDILSPSELISPMLGAKSASELIILQKSVTITAEAQREAMRSIEPGMYEYQLQAIIRYIYKINGAHGIGFPCIIGSGINSVILHWMENSRKMEDGDIVVVDIGAEYGMYWADITRTYPVNGKYSQRQKDIYEIVLKANEEAIKMIAPGVDFSDVSKKADEILAEGMLRIGLINDKSDFKKYYYHGLGHHIGLINARGANLSKLEPGMVITIEPGIYIREEELGVRIEDDVLVTETGHEVLSKNAPKKIDEVERLMSEEGININKNLIK